MIELIEYLKGIANLFEWVCFLVSLWAIRFGWQLRQDAREDLRYQAEASVNGARLMVATQNFKSRRIDLAIQVLVMIVWLALLLTPPAVRLAVGINQVVSGLSSLFITLLVAYQASSAHAANKRLIGYLAERASKE